MPPPRCCFCGTTIKPPQRAHTAPPDSLANAAAQRRDEGKPPLLHAVHLCATHKRHPPPLSHAAPRRALSDLTNTHPPHLLPIFLQRRSVTALPGQLLGEGERHKHSPLKLIERAAAVVLRADGQPLATVAAKVGCSPKAVRRWCKAFEQTETLEDEQRSGRPKMLKVGAVEAIKHHATAAPLDSTPKQLQRLLDFECSARTIRRTLDDLGLHGRVARYTPPLNEVHRMKRMSFVNGYGNWTQEQWANVLWSDEASVELGPHGQRWVQRPANAEYDPRYTVPCRKHPPKAHIWGCMSAGGVGHCFIFTEYLDKMLMRKILADHLLQSVEQLGLGVREAARGTSKAEQLGGIEGRGHIEMKFDT